MFDDFREVFNNKRPHGAIGLIPPAAVYERSPRVYPARLPPLEYPETMITRRVQKRGVMHWRGKKVFISEALEGQTVGLEPIGDKRYELYFAHVKLGIFYARHFRVLPNRRKRR